MKKGSQEEIKIKIFEENKKTELKYYNLYELKNKNPLNQGKINSEYNFKDTIYANTFEVEDVVVLQAISIFSLHIKEMVLEFTHRKAIDLVNRILLILRQQKKIIEIEFVEKNDRIVGHSYQMLFVEMMRVMGTCNGIEKITFHYNIIKKLKTTVFDAKITCKNVVLVLQLIDIVSGKDDENNKEEVEAIMRNISDFFSKNKGVTGLVIPKSKIYGGYEGQNVKSSIFQKIDFFLEMMMNDELCDRIRILTIPLIRKLKGGSKLESLFLWHLERYSQLIYLDSKILSMQMNAKLKIIKVEEQIINLGDNSFTSFLECNKLNLEQFKIKTDIFTSRTNLSGILLSLEELPKLKLLKIKMNNKDFHSFFTYNENEKAINYLCNNNLEEIIIDTGYLTYQDTMMLCNRLEMKNTNVKTLIIKNVHSKINQTKNILDAILTTNKNMERLEIRFEKEKNEEISLVRMYNSFEYYNLKNVKDLKIKNVILDHNHYIIEELNDKKQNNELFLKYLKIFNNNNMIQNLNFKTDFNLLYGSNCIQRTNNKYLVPIERMVKLNVGWNVHSHIAYGDIINSVVFTILLCFNRYKCIVFIPKFIKYLIFYFLDLKSFYLRAIEKFYF